MIVTMWGVRGSVPVASSAAARFGGNTTCIEIRTDAGDCLIIDSGTGIRGLGERLAQSGIKKATILYTHAHADHIQGLPFFPLLFDKESAVTIRGPKDMANLGVEACIRNVFNGVYFPLEIEEIACNLEFIPFVVGDEFMVGSAKIETCSSFHPGGCVAYKVTADGWSFVFSGDHEWRSKPENSEAYIGFEAFMNGADVLLADAQYTNEDYPRHKGWGHSCMDDWPAIAIRNSVKHLVLTHHAPGRSDDDLQIQADRLEQVYGHLPIRIDLAYEGMVIKNPAVDFGRKSFQPESLSSWLCDFSSDLANYTDVGMILDSVLNEARQTSHADAGTIYMVEGDDLVFAYTQNASLFSEAEAMRNIYLNARIPISPASMAGYAATTKKPLKINDVRAIPADAPYHFNDALDQTTGYRSVSMLVVPLLLKDRVLGVLQLINCLDGKGNPVPFTFDSESRIACLAGMASNALERGLMANELIMRMLAMTALRDPSETGGHVRRVGAIAAEIYQQWALRRNVGMDELRRDKDHIRLAAMLHDVGKVGVPDAILKKPGKLTDSEREVMQQHCIYGRNLFKNVDWTVDLMAREVAWHHHQRWDGKGYTGDPHETPLKGEEIPWAARITSVADVYDALVSVRCYKDAFSKPDSIAIIKEGRGTQFDPEVVDAFLEIIPVVDAIRRRYPG